jgi:cyanophycinase-like exopeptidase
VLAALEQPQRDAQGARLREQVSLLASREQGGVAVIRRFVAAARQRAGGATPRIAFVTASGFDPFDAVDYYTSLFTEAGAEAVWWPLDPASAALVAKAGECDRLTALQSTELGLPDRSLVFPDLVAEQRAWCESEHRATLPADIHGVFFAGGDQWLLRRAFVDAEHRPYPWLVALRQAVAGGALVVGGTSAGTAVQSKTGMLGNGSPQRALIDGPIHAPPPTPGCSRSRACNGLAEDAFTVWPAGGLALSGPFLMDTHFSERAREWRLLRALADGPAHAGLGVDETSAIHLRQSGELWELEAVGASGGWLFEADKRSCGVLSGKAHYLAPGKRLRWSAPLGLQTAAAAGPEGRESSPMPALPLGHPGSPEQPFGRGAVRAAVAPLALGLSHWSLDAGHARLDLARSERSVGWTGSGRHPGLPALEFRFSFAADCRGRQHPSE